MYSTKQAILTKEHLPDTECDIFYIDFRAFGKGFEEYYQRAKDLGVNYIRNLPSSVKEDPETGNLIVKFQPGEAGEVLEREYGMIVLACGIVSPDGLPALASGCGVALNQYDFIKTDAFTPLDTSREGLLVCGLAEEPKDIPETVTQASGAVARALRIVGSSRNELTTKLELPPEKDVLDDPPRIGVFVCHCGKNIGSVVDVPGVVEFAKTLDNVVYAEEPLYACSQDALEVLKGVIEENDLNRVVVASCTPRTHEPLFQSVIREGGLNPHLFEMANIRDQCSWVHGAEPEKATEKAKRLVAMAVARARLIQPLTKVKVSVEQSVAVLGGGVAGLTASLSLASQGFKVYLIEKESELGGRARFVKRTIEGEPVKPFLDSLIERAEAHPRIEIYRESELKESSGYKGNFELVLNRKGEGVDIKTGGVIVATGAEMFAGELYQSGRHPSIIDQRELEERLESGRTGGDELGEVVMIQCVGSRDDERGYCSRICCREAVKNALTLKEKRPGVKVHVLYRDIRTYGFSEKYYKQARELGVNFIRFDEEEPPEVTVEKGKVEVGVSEKFLGLKIVFNPDLLVLSRGVVASPSAADLANVLKIPQMADGFFLEAHMKLRPVDFASEGIFVCGTAHYPKTIKETIAQAEATAARASIIVARDEMEVGGAVARVEEEDCAACLTCVRVCPYGVPRIEEGVAKIEVAICQGCGICASECPANAIQLAHSTDRQTMEQVEALTCLVPAGRSGLG